MTDPQSPAAEPADERNDVDDVVGRAHEGLADAEAAGRAAVTPADEAAQPASDDAADSVEGRPAEEESLPDGRESERDASETGRTTASPYPATEPESYPAPEPESYPAPEPDSYPASEPDSYPASEPEPIVAETPAADAAWPAPAEVGGYQGAYGSAADDQPTVAVGAEAAAVAAAPVAHQPIFVQAPEAPRPRGNRGASGAIGLVATIAFGVLLLGAWTGIGLLMGTLHADGYTDALVHLLSSWTFWTPVALFFIGFWLLGAIINRGRWGHWVVWGLIVGVISWAGFVLGQFFEAPFWTITASEGLKLLETQTLAPMAVASFIIGRELTIWFGAWAAARGKKVDRKSTRLNSSH